MDDTTVEHQTLLSLTSFSNYFVLYGEHCLVPKNVVLDKILIIFQKNKKLKNTQHIHLSFYKISGLHWLRSIIISIIYKRSLLILYSFFSSVNTLTYLFSIWHLFSLNFILRTFQLQFCSLTSRQRNIRMSLKSRARATCMQVVKSRSVHNQRLSLAVCVHFVEWSAVFSATLFRIQQSQWPCCRTTGSLLAPS